MAIKRLSGINPELEVTGRILCFAGKCDFRTLLPQEAGNLLVGNVADLVVVLDDLAVLVAYSTLPWFHQGIACLVVGANIAVDAGPAFVALTVTAISHLAILATSKRAA